MAGQPRVSTIGHLLIFGSVGAREVNGSNIYHGSDFSKDKLYPLTLCVRPASACKIMSRELQRHNKVVEYFDEVQLVSVLHV